jgi:hypothetical protein
VLGRSSRSLQHRTRGRFTGYLQNLEDGAHQGLRGDSEYEFEYVPSKLDVASSSLVSRSRLRIRVAWPPLPGRLGGMSAPAQNLWRV